MAKIERKRRYYSPEFKRDAVELVEQGDIAADRRVAEAHVPKRRELPGVTRDHLSNAVYPGPRGLEERTVAALEAEAQDASFTTPYAKDSRSWPDHRRCLNQRATGRG